MQADILQPEELEYIFAMFQEHDNATEQHRAENSEEACSS